MKGLKSEGGLGRRQFLQCIGGATAATVGVLACSKTITHGNPDTIDIGDGAIAGLNLIFALEQFNAALYSRIILTPYADMPAAEAAFFSDMRAHDTAHRDLLKTLLGDAAIPTLSVDLAFIDFTSRGKTLAAIQKFADLAVAAYNGAAYLVTDLNVLPVVFKMASVDARHAAVVRNLAAAGSFADSTILDDYGMDKPVTIPTILQTLNSWLKKRLSADAFNYMPF